MNVENLREGMELISSSGIKLTQEQILLIENTLILLQNENKFTNIFFWGRINGFENDYYIAFGYTNDCLTEKKFFYSTNCFQWIHLPKSESKNSVACIYCREMFLGDPSVIITVTMDPKFVINDKQVILATEPEIFKLKEEDRLATTINLITHESAIIPRGGLYKLVNMKCLYNQEFRGLNILEANDFINYQLYREPINKYNYNLLKRNDYNYAIDFLDTLDDVIPASYSFAFNLERNETIVSIRSLLWPGMNFYHKLYSKKHGFLYFGDGKKNHDLLFMLNF